MNLDDLPAEAVIAPITEGEWAKILKGGQRFAILVKPEQREWAGKRAVNCLNCEHLGDKRGDPRRGWCLKFRCMRSGAHLVLCREYATRVD